jgi:hypothetical protein
MSMNPSSLPGCSESQPPTDPAPGGPRSDDTTGIRRQASEIIETVLSDQSPGQSRVRDQLRELLAAHPGHPETALTEHLISLGSLARFPAGDPGPLPQAAPSDGQHPVDTPAPAVAERSSRTRRS